MTNSNQTNEVKVTFDKEPIIKDKATPLSTLSDQMLRVSRVYNAIHDTSAEYRGDITDLTAEELNFYASNIPDEITREELKHVIGLYREAKHKFLYTDRKLDQATTELSSEKFDHNTTRERNKYYLRYAVLASALVAGFTVYIGCTVFHM